VLIGARQAGLRWPAVVFGRRSYSPGRSGFDAADASLAEVLESLEGADNYAAWIHRLMSPWLGQEVLEVGAGHGTMTASLIGRRRIVAADPSERCVARLRDRFADDPSVEIEQTDATQAAAGGPYESILLVNVLEHIEDDAAVLQQLATALRPGGHLVLWVPAHPSLYSAFDQRVGHYRRYRPRQLSTLVTRAGLDVSELRYVNALGAMAWWLSATVLGGTPTTGRKLRLADRGVVPVAERLERFRRPPFGLSLLCVGTRLNP
jgi:SAM-dependent methyltransferase